jgi:folate-binding protein YgfZ
LLTNDIAALKAGEGTYAAYLTPQGRMIADLWVYELGDVILLTLSRDVTAAVLAKLDQFIFTEDVQLGDVSDTFAAIAIVGPKAARAVATVLEVDSAALDALPEHGNLRAQFAGQPAIATRVTDTGVAGFDVYVDASRRDQLVNALHAEGVVEARPSTAEVLRIEAGVPRFHRDMNEDTIPLEAGIESRAISFTKGCYVGQEVIIRVMHRGHGRVARRLVGLVLEGTDVPAAGAKVQAEDREIGVVTSAAMSASLQHPIALGYVHRDFVTPGTRVNVEGTAAEVTALPFVRAHE